ncbi:MAG: hypothetical protein AAB036_07055 [Elusimicrobiota bacterium]
MKPFSLVVLLAVSLSAAEGEKKSSSLDEKTRLKVVEYMLKTPVNEASPAVVKPFLALDPETLPKQQRAKVIAKQLEISTLLKLHDTKKKGSVLSPVEGCTVSTFLKPTKDIAAYIMAGFMEITEDEEKELMDRTLCHEVDLGCQFSLTIFHDAGSKKPRRLFLAGNDPLWALVAAARAKSGASIGGRGYFGIGLASCMH